MITLIDIPFFGAAAWAASKAIREGTPRKPSQILPPGVAPPVIAAEAQVGDSIPDLCLPGSKVMTTDRQVAALTTPGGLTHHVQLTERPVRTLRYEIDRYNPTHGCWVTIRHHDLMIQGGRVMWPAHQSIGVSWFNGEDDAGNVQPSGSAHRYRIRITAPGTRIGGTGPGWLDMGVRQGEYHSGGLSGLGGARTSHRDGPTEGGGMLQYSSAALSAARTARLAPHIAPAFAGLGQLDPDLYAFPGGPPEADEDGGGDPWWQFDAESAIGTGTKLCCTLGIKRCCPALRVPVAPLYPRLPALPPPSRVPPPPMGGGGGVPWVPILAIGGLALAGITFALIRR